jgi:hypothetical protein
MMALALGAIAYSLAASATTPFSATANAATALPIAAVTVLAIAHWPLRSRPGSQPAVVPEGVNARGHPLRAWIVLVAVVVGFELFEYLAPGSRGAHPTVSSMADAVDRSRGLKAVVFLAWLCLGVAIVCAGTPARAAGVSDETDR